MAFIDTHCHLDFTDEKNGWIERAKEAGVGKIINVGTSIEGSKKSVEIAEKYSFGTNREKRFWTSQNDMIGSRNEFGMTQSYMQIYASVGIHPQDGQGDIEKYGSLDKCMDELQKIAHSSNRVVAVGEIGLDYYLVKSDKRPDSAKASPDKQVTSDKEKEFQRQLFGEQIKLAQELNLPILVHCRNAWEEVFDILKGKFSTSSNNNIKGLFHSWTGDWEAAKKALDMGFYISFSGIVTFKNAPNVQEVAKKMPLDRILVETDSPFLSPEPLRSEYYKSNKLTPTSSRRAGLRGAHMRNEPKNVIIIAQFLAQLRGVPLATIEEATSRNAGQLFGQE